PGGAPERGPLGYDLIVSDIRMADGDGQSFYREARALDARLGHRFVFITGDTANPAAWTFLTRSTCPVLAKPFTAAALHQAVHQVMTAAAEDEAHGILPSSGPQTGRPRRDNPPPGLPGGPPSPGD
ncbi:MAG TPA: response regulator, partial [Gemmatimonadales bacterium]|nr:response regulator [Gemmatimonadales bacterium]